MAWNLSVSNEIMQRTATISAVVVCSITTLYFIKKYFSGGTCSCKNRLDGKTVIITGANIGIGKSTAEALAQKGARVILACRDLIKANAVAEELKSTTGNPDIEAMELDLASLQSVRRFCAEFQQKQERLDVLINNAGVFYIPRSITSDGHETVFQTNYLGHFLLTLSLLKTLRSSAPSRIINVSSIAHLHTKWIDFDDLNHERSYHKLEVYSRSKLAQVLFTRHLAKKLQGSGITVNALHPGVVKTSIFRSYPWIWSPVGLVLNWPALYLFFKTSEQGAQTSIHCAISDECATLTGYYFSDCKVNKLKPHATDETEAERLWNKSLELVGIQRNDPMIAMLK